jgi:adenylosuccinate lyase
MIPRYILIPFDNIWSDKHRFEKWLVVETAAAEVQEELGLIPKGTSVKLKEGISIDPKRVAEIEAVTRHDVIAFLTCVREASDDPLPYLHFGLTSSDVLDTSLALIIGEAIEEIEKGLDDLASSIKVRAIEYKDAFIMGRTHGVHAEPITLGQKLAVWYAEILRHKDRLKELKPRILVGKLSGAVGNFAHNPPQVEEIALKRLGLIPEPASTQVVQRDRHAEFLLFLGLLAASLDKIVTEIRHLHRTEVKEIEQFFGKGQQGSSAMPHKRNPQICENISGLARIIKGNVNAALEDVTLWHERDISHSSVERVILPDSTTLTHYCLRKTADIIKNMLIYPENMLSNIEASCGIFYSQRLMLALIDKDITRDKAYTAVQQVAMSIHNGEEQDFKEAMEKRDEIRGLFTSEEWNEIFDMEVYRRYNDYILRRAGILD